MNLKKLKKKASRALDQLVDAIDHTGYSHMPHPYAHPPPASQYLTQPSPKSQTFNSDHFEWHSEATKALGEEYWRHYSAMRDDSNPHERVQRKAELDQWHRNETIRLQHTLGDQMMSIASDPGYVSKQIAALSEIPTAAAQMKETMQHALEQTPSATAAHAQEIEDMYGLHNLTTHMELQQRDPNRLMVLQSRGPVQEQQIASYMGDSQMSSTYRHMLSKKTGPSIKVLEQRQMELPGPKWYVNDLGVDSAFKLEVENGPIARAMRGLEDGVGFSKFNKKRYDEIGRKPLQNVCMGLSRVLDLSAGVDEIFRFRDEVNTRRKALSDESSTYEVSADEVIKSKDPIYVVSYRHTVFEEHWRMSDEQMKELFAILRLLTEGKKVRIWCDRLLPPLYTAKWEGVGLVPYTLFPVISLGCQSSFSGEEADDRLWLEVERHMGRLCHGVITIAGKVRSRASLTKSSQKLASSVQPKLIKVAGDDASVRRALLVFARSMIDGIYSTTTSSTYNLQESMRKVAMDLLRGWGIERVMGNSDELDDSHDFSGCAESVFQGLRDSAILLDNNWIFAGSLDARLERRESGATQFWDGTSEFVTDVRMAEGLNVGEMARSYFCVWEEGKEDMVVFASLKEVALHGLLLVKKEGEDHLRGRVMSRISNINFGKTVGHLDEGEVKEMMKSAFFIWIKILLEGNAPRFDCWDGSVVDFPDLQKMRQAEASFDQVRWA